MCNKTVSILMTIHIFAKQVLSLYSGTTTSNLHLYMLYIKSVNMVKSFKHVKRTQFTCPQGYTFHVIKPHIKASGHLCIRTTFCWSVGCLYIKVSL